MLSFLVSVAKAVGFLTAFIIIVIMFFDGAEFHITGECLDCIILPSLSDRFTTP